jgi:D-alanyl-D-alanine dipeptidase
MTQAVNIKNHQFDAWSEKLMALPPQLPEWRWAAVKSKEYREQYKSFPVVECNEPMVDCADYGLLSSDFYLRRLLKGAKEFAPAFEAGFLNSSAFLRRSIVSDLAAVDHELRAHGLFLHVLSGWRHTRVQELAIEWASQQYGKEAASTRYASPNFTPHSTGAACDLELWSIQTGCSLTKVDPQDDISFCGFEERTDHTPDEVLKRNVRRLLFHVMCTPDVCLPKEKCFTIHPGEAWHFGRGDLMSAFFERANSAIYGKIDVVGK